MEKLKVRLVEGFTGAVIVAGVAALWGAVVGVLFALVNGSAAKMGLGGAILGGILGGAFFGAGTAILMHTVIGTIVTKVLRIIPYGGLFFIPVRIFYCPFAWPGIL